MRFIGWCCLPGDNRSFDHTGSASVIEIVDAEELPLSVLSPAGGMHKITKWGWDATLRGTENTHNSIAITEQNGDRSVHGTGQRSTAQPPPWT